MTTTQRSRFSHRERLVLAVACTAQFIILVDTTIVAVALPAMQAGLGFQSQQLAWVVTAYTLTFAGLVLLGGRLSDMLGQRTMFSIGLSIFSVASLGGGLAQTPSQLIVARAIQGVGAALIAPTALGVILVTFRNAEARTRAFGIWAAAGPIGAGTGVLAGGLLTELISWRWVLIVNVPIGLALVAASWFAVPAEARAQRRPRLDVAGAVTGTGALIALTYAVTSAESSGWSDAVVLGAFASGALLLAAFLLVESRHPEPLVPLRLFESRTFWSSNVVMFLVSGSNVALLFFLSLYLQNIRGFSALETGLGFVPIPTGFFVGSLLAIRLVRTVGPKLTSVIGALVGASGLLLLTTLGPSSHYLTSVGVLGPLTTIGLSLVTTASSLSATQGIRKSESGIASGILGAIRQGGGSLGLALMVTVAGVVTANASGSETARLVAGYNAAFAFAGTCLLVAGTLAFAFLPGVLQDAPEPAEAVVENAGPAAPTSLATD